MRRILILLFTIHCSLFTATAQTIKEGSGWWDGIRLYKAHIEESGVTTMRGESKDLGGDMFQLLRLRDGVYQVTAERPDQYMSIRGRVGSQVDYIQKDGLNFLVVRKPNGVAAHTFVLTPDNLKNCLIQQKISEERDVSWMLQNAVLDIHYLGRFSKSQLRLMRNEILARHGWRFQSKDLQEYFGAKDWYKPEANNNAITLNIIEQTNLQMLKSEEAVDGRVRYENVETAPTMAKAVDGVITVTNEEQFINALGNYRTILIGEDVHLNLSRILEQEDKFSGIPGRGWATNVESSRNTEPAVISEFCNDGQQLTLRNICNLTIRGQHNSSIEVAPRYAFCLNFIDCYKCKVENLTIGHTEGGYCDGGVIGVKGGNSIEIIDCDLYGCGTYGIVGRETVEMKVERCNVHDCTYGIMELWGCNDTRFVDCDFFSNREYELIGNGSSSNTVFEGCRFFSNWPSAPLFSTSVEIELYRCEIYHPNIGDRELLKDPENNCKWGAPDTVPEPRKKAIGPDRN